MNEEYEKYAVGYCMTDKEFSQTDGKTGRYLYFNEISPGDYIFTGNFVKDLQTKLDEQAKELEDLRGFASSLVKKYKTVKDNGCDKPLTVLVIAKEFKLIDENGNPTTLLTGDK